MVRANTVALENGGDSSAGRPIRRKVLACSCLLLVCGTAQADPVTFRETASADLSGALTAPAPFAFDSGVNTVTGRLAFLPNRQFDLDSFAFSVPIGMQVTAISYASVTTFRPGVESSQSSFSLLYGLGGGARYLNDFTALVPASSGPTLSDAFFAALPLGPGVYGLENFGLAFSYLGGTSGEGFSQRYTWSFTVAEATAPVPEPASVSLLAVTLTGLAVRYRIGRRSGR